MINLEKIENLVGMDTSNVTNMSIMFANAGYKITNFITSFTILNRYVNDYYDIFLNVAIQDNSKVTLNYTSRTSELVDKILNRKSEASNIVKGAQVS